jgi:glc operon protein GlcG
MDLTLDVARQVADAALAAAHRLGIPMTVAVCDSGGHVITLDRMDNCMVFAAEAVQAKARTAVYFRRATADTVERSRVHPTVYSSFVDVSASPIVLSMGGLPLWSASGRLVGAVAASGGSGEDDVDVAVAGERRWAELQAVPLDNTPLR